MTFQYDRTQKLEHRHGNLGHDVEELRVQRDRLVLGALPPPQISRQDQLELGGTIGVLEPCPQFNESVGGLDDEPLLPVEGDFPSDSDDCLDEVGQ